MALSFHREYAKTIPRPFSVRYNPYTQSVEVIENKNQIINLTQTIKGKLNFFINFFLSSYLFLSTFLVEKFLINGCICNNFNLNNTILICDKMFELGKIHALMFELFRRSHAFGGCAIENWRNLTFVKTHRH